MREIPTHKEDLFIRAYLKNPVAVEAAKTVWAPGYARKNAHMILRRPRVAKAIADAQEELRRSRKYDLEQAVEEADRLLAAAEKAGQFSAVSSLYQTKVKLHGLIQDKLKVEVEAKPSIGDAIDAGRLRAGLPPRIPRNTEIIDATPISTTLAPAERGGKE